MNLYSERLILQELDWDHLDNIHTLNSFTEVDRYNTLGIPESIEVTKELIKPIIDQKELSERNLYSWAIYLSNENIFIGQVGIKLAVKRFRLAELYFNLIPDKWGNGYATEAARTVLKFGFDYLNLHRMEAGVATENQASIRLLEKLGMTREGLRRKILPVRGEWKDNYHYSILQDEYHD